ncbi:MAG: cysteine desulfurase-like protein [Thermoplasmata archaeon]
MKEDWIDEFSKYVREQFPSLKNKVNGHPMAYLDGPGGYQVPERVMDAVEDYLKNMNSNIHGHFKTSEETDKMKLEARRTYADFFNCSHEEVAFGANMTTMNFMLAQAIRKEIQPGEKILITQLDHAGNRTPWERLEDEGVVVEEVEVDTETLTIDMEDFRSKLTEDTKVVAVTYGCNAVGTIPNVGEIVDEAHEVGAYTVVDAVHYAAHSPIDVEELGTDFLICSAYKFFGPHIGVMYADKDVLAELDTLKVRPQEETPPQKFETGTLNHEGIAGAKEAVEFVADVGKRFSSEVGVEVKEDWSDRRKNIVAGLKIFEKYEEILTERLVEGLSSMEEVTLYRPPSDVRSTSTVSFTHDLYTPTEIAAYLGDRGIFVWDGHFYALRLIEVLDLLDKGGVVRIGVSPYNTMEEIERVIEAMKDSECLKEEIG